MQAFKCFAKFLLLRRPHLQPQLKLLSLDKFQDSFPRRSS